MPSCSHYRGSGGFAVTERHIERLKPLIFGYCISVLYRSVLCTKKITPANSSFLTHQSNVPIYGIKKMCLKQTRMTLSTERRPQRCIVRLYKLYNSKCPPNRPINAFYLKPLLKPTVDCWYQAYGTQSSWWHS